MTDPLGNTTQYTYDALGNVASTTDAMNNTTTNAYDLDGRLVSTTNTLNHTTTCTCSHLPPGEGQGEGGGLSQFRAPSQAGSDENGTVPFLVASQTDANSDVTKYTYDSDGNLLTLTDPDGNTTTYAYDADGQYATITRYADLAGTELVATATYSFDDAYQLLGLSYTKGTTTLASYNYTFDAAGNMTSMTTVDGTTNYTSDATGQLTAAGSDTYRYDSNGNRTTANGSTYVTGVNNELMDDGTYTYTYDSEGNRLTKTDKATGAQMDYTWDYRDRLNSVTFKDSSGNVTETVYYQYDAFNHLVGETVSVPGQAAQQTVYVYDRGQIVSQFDGTGSLDSSNLSHRYLWNPQAVDQLFADEQLSPLPPGEGGGEGYDLTTPGNVLWALTDHENSVRDLATYDPGTDVTTIANHRVYDAYGNLTSQTNAAVDCLFGYTGRQFDTASGLQNNLNRWYDPTVGRWLSQDPSSFWAGDSNLYRYVRNSPSDWIDPWGLCERGAGGNNTGPGAGGNNTGTGSGGDNAGPGSGGSNAGPGWCPNRRPDPIFETGGPSPSPPPPPPPTPVPPWEPWEHGPVIGPFMSQGTVVWSHNVHWSDGSTTPETWCGSAWLVGGNGDVWQLEPPPFAGGETEPERNPDSGEERPVEVPPLERNPTAEPVPW